MNQETLNRLDALAAKLGVAAEHVWAVLIKQSRVEALSVTLGFLGALAVLVFCILWFQRLNENEGDALPVSVVGIVLAGIAVTVLGVVGLKVIPTALFNPEYYALSKILAAMK